MEVRLLKMLQQGKPSRSPCIRFEDSSIYLHCTYFCSPGENLHMKTLGMLVGNLGVHLGHGVTCFNHVQYSFSCNSK